MSPDRGPWIAVGAAAVLGLVYWGWVVEIKPKRAKEAEDAKLLFKGLDAADTDEILLRKTGGPDVLLRKVDKQWRLITPTAAPADAQAVDSLVSQLAGAKRNSIIVDKGADLRDFGLDKPSGEVTFKPSSPGAKAKVLYFGLDNPSGDQTYGFIDGLPEVFLTYKSVKTSVLKDAGDLRDKTVWTFQTSDVESVRSDVEGFTLAHEPKTGIWQVRAPGRTEPAKNSSVDEWLGELANLRAEAVPSETGKGAFGINPAHRLTLTLKGGTALTLLVGKRSQPKPQPQNRRSAPLEAGVYVQVAGQGPVFQLPGSAVDAVGKKATEIMDLNAFALQTGDAQRLEISRPKGKLVAVKKAGVWSWEPPLEQKPGDKPFDFYGFISLIANAQLIKRLDAAKDKIGAEQTAASVTFFGDNDAVLEKCVFGPMRSGGQVVTSAQKNQTVLAANNLLASLPPDVPRAAPAATAPAGVVAAVTALASAKPSPGASAAPANPGPLPKPLPTQH